MKAIRPALLCALLASLPCAASNDVVPIRTHAASSFDQIVQQCAPDISLKTFKAVIRTESSFNPYAIGVVGGHLARQPRNLNEALAIAHDLERQGYNFSLGLGQVNRHNLSKYGETYATIFEPCHNLKIGGEILKNCYQAAKAKISDEQQALRAAFSCYYSGNFTRGFRVDASGKPSYVAQVVANADTAQPLPVVPEIKPQPDEAPVHVIKHGERTRPSPPPLVIFTDQESKDAQQGKQNEKTEPSGKGEPPSVQLIN